MKLNETVTNKEKKKKKDLNEVAKVGRQDEQMRRRRQVAVQRPAL